MNATAEVIFLIIFKIKVVNPTEYIQRFGQTGVRLKRYKVPLYRVKIMQQEEKGSKKYTHFKCYTRALFTLLSHFWRGITVDLKQRCYCCRSAPALESVSLHFSSIKHKLRVPVSPKLTSINGASFARMSISCLRKNFLAHLVYKSATSD